MKKIVIALSAFASVLSVSATAWPCGGDEVPVVRQIDVQPINDRASLLRQAVQAEQRADVLDERAADLAVQATQLLGEAAQLRALANKAHDGFFAARTELLDQAQQAEAQARQSSRDARSAKSVATQLRAKARSLRAQAGPAPRRWKTARSVDL